MTLKLTGAENAPYPDDRRLELFLGDLPDAQRQAIVSEAKSANAFLGRLVAEETAARIHLPYVPPSVAHAVALNRAGQTKAREESRQRARERARDAKGRFVAEAGADSLILPLVASAVAVGVMVGVALVRWFG